MMKYCLVEKRNINGFRFNRPGFHNLEISVSDGISQSGDTQIKKYMYIKPELTNTPPNQAFVNVEYRDLPTALDLYNQSNIKKMSF